MSSIKDVADKAASALGQGVDSISDATRGFLGTAQARAKSLYSEGLKALDESKVYVEKGVAVYKEGEDVVFATLKDAVELVIKFPAIAYPLGFTALVLTIPASRSWLTRFVVTRFRSQEAMLKSAEQRVEALKVRAEEFSAEASKLEARMKTAEEEYLRGLSKLRSTRSELQRLESQVQKSQRQAQGTLKNLRYFKAVQNTAQLRSEAASALAAFNGQRVLVQKYIYRITKRDV